MNPNVHMLTKHPQLPIPPLRGMVPENSGIVLNFDQAKRRNMSDQL
jgi:hypothetical protein